jgi:uncharacterized glyoxalase superfamily protein PhnB
MSKTKKKTKKAAKKAAKKAVNRVSARRRSSPQSLRLRAFVPSLTVNDVRSSMEWYERVLGFVPSDHWVENGKLLGVMLRAGLCEIGLSQDDWKKGRDRKKGQGVRLACRTDQDIDELAARIQAAGGKLTAAPKDDTWDRRVRSLSLDDPDGYHLTFFRNL